MLLHYYKFFYMLPHESISNMYIYFTKIIISLHALGREFIDAEKGK